MSINPVQNASWQTPTRKEALSFWCRSTLLVAWHALRDTASPRAKRWHVGHQLANAPVIAQRRSPLWADGRSDEFPLIAGKVHNLRIAGQAFHAIEIPAGETFSFWKQLGRPSAGRGFVEGREVREGCVVPTLAGGICQLSNALATAALHAKMELLERHGHSARIETSNEDHANTIDATVFWNYIDLKLRAPFSWRLEVEMTAEELIVSIRAVSKPIHKLIPLKPTSARMAATTPVARGCLTCDQIQCFRHRPRQEQTTQGRAAVLLDIWSPEFVDYLQQNWPDGDYFIPVPWRLALWRPSNMAWQMPHPFCRANWTSMRRAMWQRMWAKHAGGRRQASIIDGARWLAQAYAKQLRPEHTTLVIDQSLLPHLAASNALHGRRVIVLANALPMRAIQERLDAAARRWPQDASLRDFRADAALMQHERDGLLRAERIVTTHADVALQMPGFTKAAVDRLPWQVSAARACGNSTAKGRADAPIIVFPSTAIARKGVRELAQALQGLPCRLRVLGEPPQDSVIFAGLSVEYVAPGNRRLFDDASIVALPAHVEHNPRLLLNALAHGLPVVATSACGLAAGVGLHLVEAGNVDELRDALVRLISTASKQTST